jgi:hypothetical protein
MSEVGTASPVASPTSPSRRWLWSPPGVLFFLGTAVAILAALDANSLGSWTRSLMAQFFWYVVAGIWVTRFLGTAWTRRLRFPIGHWVRWLAVPAILGFVLVLTRLDVPFDVRLSLSRGAMDQAAAEVMAGGTTDRTWIGLYPVERVERTPTGMRFLIMGSGFIDHIGLAYSTAGEPVNVDGNDLYGKLDGGWWTWVDRF